MTTDRKDHDHSADDHSADDHSPAGHRAGDQRAELRPYPTREEASAAWERLAAELISAAGQHPGDVAAPESAGRGRLTIVGSGIDAAGFTGAAEQAIDEADRVFYCVADPATQLWIRERRPDAYDLYVLYEDTKPRYHTYVQMSEAMLHYVRRGENVAAVFYGHPGVFALSTHRALRIARRERHEATMQAGVSALDCLCADLSVDPSYPGMATFEATEMMLRGRVPDPTLHVVLWQVGVIGEQGYRRRGFTNTKFPLLIEYLQRFYPAGAPVVHYIAARYPTLPPVIEDYTLADLAKPRNFARINGISTLYIPPVAGARQDPEMAARLGFPAAQAQQLPPVRTVDGYGPRESAALASLAGFKVPADYQYQRKTRAGEFVLALTRDSALREQFRRQPGHAVSGQVFPGLNAWERRMLASRDSGRMQIAAKQSKLAAAAAEQFVMDLYTNQALARQFSAETTANFKVAGGQTAINHWLAAQGYDTTVAGISAAQPVVQATMLLAWTGIYRSADGTLNVTVVGDPVTNDNSVIYVNASRITGFTFTASTLSWASSRTNPVNGSLVFSAPAPAGSSPLTRQASGTIWAAGSTEPTAPNASLTEVVLTTNPLSVWTGRYQTMIGTAPGPELLLTATPVNGVAPSPGGAGIQLSVSGSPVTNYAFDGRTLSWTDSAVTFAAGEQPGSATLNGTLSGKAVSGTLDATYTTPYVGQYDTQQLVSGTWSAGNGVYYDGKTLTIGNQKITTVSWASGAMTWEKATGQYDSGRLQFVIDAMTYLPTFSGFTWAAGAAQPATPNIRGTLSMYYLSSWSGSYPTSYATGAAGPGLTIEGSPPPGVAIVQVGGTNAGAISYYNSELAGVVGSDKFDITFALAAAGARTFDGSYNATGWSSKGSSSQPNQWVGDYSTQSLDSWGTFTTDPAIMSIQVTGTVVTVEVNDAGTTGKVANPVFDPTYNTITWGNDKGMPARFANAAIALTFSTGTTYKSFTGSYWAAGASPPPKANWRGSNGQQPAPPVGLPPWLIALITGGALLTVGTIIYGIWRACRYNATINQLFNRQYTAIKVCKINGPETPLSVGDSDCDDAQEEADESGEAAEAEEDYATEANPGDMPQVSGQEPEFEDPNIDVDVDVDVDIDVDIDVDTDVDTDVDVDVDVDVDIDIDVDFIAVVDVDIDIDIDIDTDVDSVVDNVTDNVVDTVVDNVTVLETLTAGLPEIAEGTGPAAAG
ncbi:MAG TPA: SAM-dependent methyltransferase [Streptosporangiaceae bacterium]